MERARIVVTLNEAAVTLSEAKGLFPRRRCFAMLSMIRGFRIHNSAFGGTWIALCLTIALCGCQQAGLSRSLDLIPTHEAAQLVNANAAKITGTLRASGSVDGYFTTPKGRRRNYHVDGTLFYLAPRYFRFDLKSFGDRQILLGSNDQHYWFYNKQDDTYYCGRHGSNEDLPVEVPIRPDQLIDALALSPIHVLSLEGGSADTGSLNPDDQGRFQLRKEYWGDRDSPQIIRRVQYRDDEGTVTMQSSLDKHKPLSPDGPLLPYLMVAHWPNARAHMRFRVDKWTLVNQVLPGGPQFATPVECSVNERADRPTGK